MLLIVVKLEGQKVFKAKKKKIMIIKWSSQHTPMVTSHATTFCNKGKIVISQLS